MGRIKAILVDLDGTLVEFKIDYIGARREAIKILEGLGLFPNSLFSINDSVFKMSEKASDYLRKIGMEERVAEEIHATLMRVLDKYEMEAARNTAPLPEAAETLAKLKSIGPRLVLFTSNGEKAVNYVLTKFQLNHYFDLRLSRDAVPKAKPHPDHALTALSILGVKREEAVIVGDGHPDIQSARAAGIVSVGVLSGRAQRSDLEKAGADYIISSIREFPELLKQIDS